MTSNSIAPGFMRFRYVANAHTHYKTYPINIPADAEPGEAPVCATKGGGTANPVFWIADTYAPAWQAWYKDTDTLVEVEFWKKTLPADDPLYLWTEPLSIDGTGSGGTQQIASQVVISMRTILGGILFDYMMETHNFNLAAKDLYPFTQAKANNIALALSDDTSPVIGRDGGPLIIGVALSTKINDALRNKYLQNA